MKKAKGHRMETVNISPAIKDRLIALALALIDQKKARVVVKPYDDDGGFWFGGGNMIHDRYSGSGVDQGAGSSAHPGVLIVGRYRNRGDSRTGLQMGARGLECAIWRSPDGLSGYELVKKWDKADLACAGRQVISIEGTALHLGDNGVELFISSEKEIPYPEP